MSKTRNPDALIRIEDAIKVLCWATCCPGPCCPDGYCTKMWDEFEEVERVDAVPVVRCRDCRYSQRINEWVYHCYMWNDDKMFNQYCDMGERKDGDHETD